MAIQIQVHDHNATFSIITGDQQALDIIYDRFAYYVDGYRFMTKYKEKMWDGKIRLFNRQTQTLYRHLIHDVELLAKDRDWDFIDNRKFHGYRFDENHARGFCAALKVTGGGNPIEFRDYQINTVIAALGHDCSTIISPTASGKSLSIYAVVRHALLQFAKSTKKILVVVPTVQLVSQLASDFADYSEFDPSFDANNSIHCITAGIDKNTSKPVVISTWQSLINIKDRNYFTQYHTVIVDEVHLANAKSLTHVIEACTHAYNRHGFTGTLKNCTANIMCIKAMMGQPHRVATTSELIEQGYLANLDITAVVMKYPEDLCQKVARAKAKYQDEVKYITGKLDRNIFIVRLAQACKGNTLVLFNHIDGHGKPLFELAKKIITDKEIFFISGKTPAKEREKIRKYMETIDGVILFASYGTLSTGINIKNLDNAIFASPYKSKIKVMQSIGRVLRKLKDDSRAKLFDIADDLRYKKYINHVYSHFMVRLSYYNDEGFPVKVQEYKLQ